MCEPKKPFNAIALGCALAAAALVGSCGGGGDTADALAVAVYIKASNAGLGDQLGGSLAISGDGNTLAIGARFEDSGLLGVTAGVVDELTAGNAVANSGAVYVLIRSGTAWGQQAYVKPLNTGTTGVGDNFGFSVALSSDGNTLAVGAPLEDSNTAGINSTPNESAIDAGAVYVFTRSVTGVWTQQAYIKASTPGAGDNFGISVALSSDGNTLAVGAPLEDSGTTGINSIPNEAATDAGAAYVFTRDGTGTWSEQAYVKTSNTGLLVLDKFGVSVSLSSDGNTLAVGANGEASGTLGINTTPDETAPGAGAAYVFARSGITWTQQAYVKASNTNAADDFGSSVALSGDGNTLAVGAPREDSSATGINSPSNELATDAGAVYVFTRSGITWTQQAYVKASNTGIGGDNFGGSVALSGDGNALMVGAINEDGGATGINSPSNELAADAGAVYAYTRSATAWAQQSYVKASNTGAGDGFGVSVALSSNGSTRVIGAPFEDSDATGVGGNQANNNAASAGAVYIYP